MFEWVKDTIDNLNRRLISAMAGIGLPTGVQSAISGAVATGLDLKQDQLPNLMLSSGHYIFIAKTNSGWIDKSLEDNLSVYTDEGKRIQVNWWIYHIDTSEIEIGIRIYDNPIPYVIVWGLVMTVLIGVTGLAVGLNVKEIKKVITTPAGMGLVVMGLIIASTVGFKAIKKGGK